MAEITSKPDAFDALREAIGQMNGEQPLHMLLVFDKSKWAFLTDCETPACKREAIDRIGHALVSLEQQVILEEDSAAGSA
jgi:hypothetical protein